MKRTKRLNQLGLGIIIMVYFLLLAGSRFHIIPANIHVVPLFACILIAITIILGFIIVHLARKNSFCQRVLAMAGPQIHGMHLDY